MRDTFWKNCFRVWMRWSVSEAIMAAAANYEQAKVRNCARVAVLCVL